MWLLSNMAVVRCNFKFCCEMQRSQDFFHSVSAHEKTHREWAKWPYVWAMEIATRCLSIAAAPFQRRTCAPTSPVINRSKLFYKNRYKFNDFFGGLDLVSNIARKSWNKSGTTLFDQNLIGGFSSWNVLERSWRGHSGSLVSDKESQATDKETPWKQSWPEEREWESEQMLWPWDPRCWRDFIPKSWGYSPPLRFKMIQFISFVKSEVWSSSTDGNFLTDLAWFPSPVWHKIGVVDLGSNLDPLWCRNFAAMGTLAELIAIWFCCQSCQSDRKFWCHRKKMSRTLKTRVGIMYV